MGSVKAHLFEEKIVNHFGFHVILKRKILVIPPLPYLHSVWLACVPELLPFVWVVRNEGIK